MINDWLQINKLPLNVDKTKYLIFHNHQKNVSLFKELTLELNGENMKRSDTFNFLGIVLNEQLTWNSHITHLSSKIHPLVGLW